METARAFVGCLLDLGATRRLVDASRALRRSLDAAGWKASWVPPPNLHFTLKFLGDVDTGTAPALSDALALVAKRHAPLRVGVKGLVAFPDREAPRVLAADVVEGHEALAALARAVDEACLELGFAREKRPFHGHVTLARVKHQAGPLAALPMLPIDAGFGVVSELTLYRSDLAREGAEYHALSRHALGSQNPAQGQPMSPQRR